MTQLLQYQREAEQFATHARHYCSLNDRADSLGREKLLRNIYLQLPVLILEGQRLPAVHFGEDDCEQETSPTDMSSAEQVREHSSQWNFLTRTLGTILGELGGYWMTFDPRKDSGQVHGSLDDDLADIYLDLRCGLAVLPKYRDAVFEWRMSFNTHWGKHAMDALHLLHWYSRDCMLEE